MTLAQCSACGREVRVGIHRCPQCGTSWPTGMTAGQRVFSVALLGAFAAIVAYVLLNVR